MEEDTNKTGVPVPPTEDQIKEYEAKMLKFYNERLPFIRVKAEYEKLNSEIAQDNLKELLAVQQYNKIKAEIQTQTPGQEKKS